jgi:hypothetical protein
MELAEFSRALTKLCDFYERKEPKHGSIELWFESVGKMPSEPISAIVRKIQETHDTFPRNLPATFWAAYNEWIQAHPEKRTIRNYFNCPDCNEGLLFCIHNETRGRFVFRCVLCRQDNTRAYPFGSRKSLSNEYSFR